MTNMNHISPEILHLIIEKVYDEDEPLYSIKSCSLVNHVWHAIAEKFLFRRVTFTMGQKSIYTFDFVDFLITNEKLHGVIRLVRLKVLEDLPHCPFSLQKQIKRLFSKLTRLTSVVIYYVNDSRKVLDLGVFSKDFLHFLGRRPKTDISIQNCHTFDDSALLLPLFENIVCLSVQVSVFDHRDVRVRELKQKEKPRRENYQYISNSDSTGSKCLSQVLRRNVRLRNLDIRLGRGGNRGWDLERMRCLPLLGSRLVNLTTLTLTGKFTGELSWFPIFEKLQSLSILGNSFLGFVVDNMLGFFPVLEELRLNTRETMHNYPAVRDYYGSDGTNLLNFIKTLPIQKLTMCGFSADCVDLILRLQLNLTEFDCHDLDIFSEHLPTPRPELESYSDSFERDSRERNTRLPRDDVFRRNGALRWPALNFLERFRSDLNFSKIHTNASIQLILDRSTDHSLSRLSILGLDIERYFLITDMEEFENDDSGLNLETRERKKKRECVQLFFNGDETLIDRMIARMEVLDKLCLFPKVQEINLHLVEIRRDNYWLLTAKEIVQTFAYLHSHKIGRPLLRLYIADTYCAVRYLVRYIGSDTVFVDILHGLHHHEAQLWKINPIEYLHEEKPDFVPIRETGSVILEGLKEPIEGIF